MNSIEEYGERRRQEGREEGKEEIILNLHESGMTIKEIAKKTKIDIKEIEKIINR